MLLFAANGYMQERVVVTLADSLQWAFKWLITAHFGQIFVFFLKICVSDFNGLLLFGIRHELSPLLCLERERERESRRLLEVIRDLMEVGLGVVPRSFRRPFNRVWLCLFHVFLNCF